MQSSAARADIPSIGVNLPDLTYGYATSADLVFDHTHDQLVVAAAGGIDAVALGTSPPVTHVPSPTDVGGLALSDDESTLWYSDFAAGHLVSVPTASLGTAAGTVAVVPDAQCPQRLAVDGTDRVWFVYHPCAAPDDPAGLGVYDPSTDQFDLAPIVDAHIPDLGGLTVLDNNPSAPNTLVVASATDTSTIDAATNTVHTDSSSPGGASSVAITSDGSHFVRAGGALTQEPVGDPGSTAERVGFDPTPLDAAGTAIGAALSSDGAILAGAFGSDIVSFGTASGDHAWIRRCETVRSDVTAMAWVGTSVWFVQDGYPTLSLERCDNMTTPQSYIATSGPEAPKAGSVVQLHLRLTYRDEPIADAPISVYRINPPQGSAPLPDLVTDQGGKAVLQSLARRSGTSYQLTYAGDSSHLGYTTSAGVTGVWKQSEFARAPGDLNARIDHAVTIRNRLITTSGEGIGGRTVEVVRADATGRHVVTGAVTDRSGRFTIHAVPKYGPNATFYVRYAGEPAYGRSATLAYHARVARLRPTLSITVRRPAVRYGKRAVVHVHLGHTYHRRTVTLFALPARDGLHRVFTGAVGRDGNLTRTVAMRQNTTFLAAFKGDARYGPRRVSVEELSRLRPTIRLSGGSGSSGRDRLFHTGQAIRLTGTVPIAFHFQCLHFTVSHRDGGTWQRDWRSGCVVLNHEGVGWTFYPRRPVAGLEYAVAASVTGDMRHSWVPSPVRYLRLTA